MYPLNMTLPSPAIGFALANDEQEHADLTTQGYAPAYVKPEKAKKSPVVADEQKAE